MLSVVLFAGLGAADEADLRTALELLEKQRTGTELSAEDLAVIQKAAGDWRSVQRIRDRGRRGEALTADEKKLVNLAQEIRAKRAEEARAAYRKETPPRTTTGLVALTDLGSGAHLGKAGGLYPGGLNDPPRKHLDAGLRIARSIVPLDIEGRPSPDGAIVLLSQGMSNTTQEFRAFQELASNEKINPRVLLVDGAQGGQSADRTADPAGPYWTRVARRLEDVDATAEQVQVVWLKNATPRPSKPFPAEALALKQHLLANLHILHNRFPNLKIAYLSSRIYAGYAESSLNPEPHAYESGFAVKWLIVDQIEGNPMLNFDAAVGDVRSPWIAWGPYLWADGLNVRSDGLSYAREELADDGTHPSQMGRKKVGAQLLKFLMTDPTARSWFLAE
jgi:hypothetical protein